MSTKSRLATAAVAPPATPAARLQQTRQQLVKVYHHLSFTPNSPCQCPWRGRPCTSSRTGRSWWGRSRRRWRSRSRWWNPPVRAATGHTGFSWLLVVRLRIEAPMGRRHCGSSRLDPVAPLSPLPHPHTTQSMGEGSRWMQMLMLMLILLLMMILMLMLMLRKISSFHLFFWRM